MLVLNIIITINDIINTVINKNKIFKIYKNTSNLTI